MFKVLGLWVKSYFHGCKTMIFLWPARPRRVDRPAFPSARSKNQYVASTMPLTKRLEATADGRGCVTSKLKSQQRNMITKQ